jgi:hypothetical protein
VAHIDGVGFVAVIATDHDYQPPREWLAEWLEIDPFGRPHFRDKWPGLDKFIRAFED